MKYHEFITSEYCPVCNGNLYIEEIIFDNGKSVNNKYCECGWKSEKYNLDLAFKFCK